MNIHIFVDHFVNIGQLIRVKCLAPFFDNGSSEVVNGLEKYFLLPFEAQEFKNKIGVQICSEEAHWECLDEHQKILAIFVSLLHILHFHPHRRFTDSGHSVFTGEHRDILNIVALLQFVVYLLHRLDTLLNKDGSKVLQDIEVEGGR